MHTKSNQDVHEAIKKSKLLRPSEGVKWVEIKELRPNGQVLLEVWARSIIDAVRRKERSNVFHILIDENPEWVCESDIGRGLIGV